MPDKLPRGWVKTTLGDIVEPSRERVLPAEVPTMRYVGLEHIEAETMRLLGYGSAREVLSSSIRFYRGDVLYGKMRPYLNKVWVAEFDGLCSAEFLVFSQRESLNNVFLAMRLNSDDFVAFSNAQVSGERPRVNFEKLAGFSILLPPIAEQARIVEKLSRALLKVERAQAASRRAQDGLAAFRASVSDAAVRGELSESWRKAQRKRKNKDTQTGPALLQRIVATRRARWEQTELHRFATGSTPKGDMWKARYHEPSPPDTRHLPELPIGWTWASPEQLSAGDRHALAIGPFGSNLKVSDYRTSGVPLIFVRNIRTGIFADDGTHFVSKKKAQELEAHKVTGGDILITKMGDPPGDVRLYPPDAPTAIITADCIRLQLSSLLEQSKMFFIHAINSNFGRAQILHITKGVAQQKVSLSRFSTIALPLPPLNEQVEITRRINQRLVAADRLSTTLERQLAQSRAARQSLLHEAFGGHLLSQNPGDESAVILLERIRADREAETKKPRSKSMPKREVNSKTARRPLVEVLREHKRPITPEQLFHEARFEPSQVELFYRELVSLRKVLTEEKPAGRAALSWPKTGNVLLQIKNGAKK